ncbi:unnamed protein product, partial [Closterium sp. NIES-53]
LIFFRFFASILCSYRHFVDKVVEPSGHVKSTFNKASFFRKRAKVTGNTDEPLISQLLHTQCWQQFLDGSSSGVVSFFDRALVELEALDIATGSAMASVDLADDDGAPEIVTVPPPTPKVVETPQNPSVPLLTRSPPRSILPTMAERAGGRYTHRAFPSLERSAEEKQRRYEFLQQVRLAADAQHNSEARRVVSSDVEEAVVLEERSRGTNRLREQEERDAMVGAIKGKFSVSAPLLPLDPCPPRHCRALGCSTPSRPCALGHAPCHACSAACPFSVTLLLPHILLLLPNLLLPHCVRLPRSPAPCSVPPAPCLPAPFLLPPCTLPHAPLRPSPCPSAPCVVPQPPTPGEQKLWDQLLALPPDEEPLSSREYGTIYAMMEDEDGVGSSGFMEVLQDKLQSKVGGTAERPALPWHERVDSTSHSHHTCFCMPPCGSLPPHIFSPFPCSRPSPLSHVHSPRQLLSTFSAALLPPYTPSLWPILCCCAALSSPLCPSLCVWQAWGGELKADLFVAVRELVVLSISRAAMRSDMQSVLAALELAGAVHQRDGAGHKDTVLRHIGALPIWKDFRCCPAALLPSCTAAPLLRCPAALLPRCPAALLPLLPLPCHSHPSHAHSPCSTARHKQPLMSLLLFASVHHLPCVP